MKIYRFDKEVGKQIGIFQSNFIMSKILNYSGQIHIGCMHVPENGVVGYHEAVTNQLLLVVQGEGYVCGENKEKIYIQAGQAAFWEKGEKHETSTHVGLMAIVIEGENLSLNMPILQK
ncbi:cupin [Bacillus pseudomycoides]|nr:cupin [Bacillus pseudomycoides]